MAKPDRAHLRELLGKATPGPWEVDSMGDISRGPFNVCIPYATKNEDRDLIVAAVNALPALLATADRVAALEAVTKNMLLGKAGARDAARALLNGENGAHD